MSQSSRTDYFFHYPKFEDGSYTGHTICVVLREGRMFIGESLCSVNDQFNKKIGRKLALERAELAYERYVNKKLEN